MIWCTHVKKKVAFLLSECEFNTKFVETPVYDWWVVVYYVEFLQNNAMEAFVISYWY